MCGRLPPCTGASLILHNASIALSAFLLFLLQPVIARLLLPGFGGSAAVWTTCLAFFQVALVAGYAYSDLAIRHLRPRRQVVLHAAMIAASLIVLPLSLEGLAGATDDVGGPVLRILALLTAAVGLPYLMLSTTTPLVQAWAARAGLGQGAYRLYALSNLLSIVALLAYPTLVEPLATSRDQALAWSVGYGVFAALTLALCWRIGQALPADAPAAIGQNEPTHIASEPAPSARHLATWFGLSMLGSMLLVGVTAHLTQDIAPIPMLWMLPLAVYLLTFIVCFDGRGWYWPRTFTVLGCVTVLAILAGMLWKIRVVGDLRAAATLLKLAGSVPLHCLGLFVLCMFCHGELARRRPEPAHLTRFYLMLALGGAAGGIASGILAPLTLSWYWELPIALVAFTVFAVLASRGLIRAVSVLACIGAVALAGMRVESIVGDSVLTERNFYGALRVVEEKPEDAPGVVRSLMHGTILHGAQAMWPEMSREPTAYYARESGVGRAFEALRAEAAGVPKRVGLIGMGVATLAAYGEAGDTFRFYELNPLVPEIARTRFRYLQESAASVETVIGDGRVALEREAPHGFDLLVVDAFSGDAIPTHLLTREAALAYRRQLSDHGVIAMHISNRYLDLRGICLHMAQALGWKAWLIEQDDESDLSTGSTWVLITGSDALMDRFRAWPGRELTAAPGVRPWTDQYSSLLQVLRFDLPRGKIKSR